MRKEKSADLNAENHPLRLMAKRIVDEVVEIQLGMFFTHAQSKRMENDIVALLTNL